MGIGDPIDTNHWFERDIHTLQSCPICKVTLKFSKLRQKDSKILKRRLVKNCEECASKPDDRRSVRSFIGEQLSSTQHLDIETKMLQYLERCEVKHRGPVCLEAVVGSNAGIV